MSLHRDGLANGPRKRRVGGDCELEGDPGQASHGVTRDRFREGSAPFLQGRTPRCTAARGAATECGWKPGDRGAERTGSELIARKGKIARGIKLNGKRIEYSGQSAR